MGDVRAKADSLESVFDNPPQDARLRAYWWWINGNVTRESITRDLEQMKAKGFGGALICDADGSSQDGNDRAPHGPTFFTPEWRQLYKHTLREADRLGLEMSLNIQSGWNLGGPMVSADDAPKKLVWTETRVAGETNLNIKLSQARGRDGYYRDLFVLAYRVNPALPGNRRPLQNQQQKALLDVLRPFSAPDSTPLFQEFSSTADEQDTKTADVIDLTRKMESDGTLKWNAPAGQWQIIRFGCTLNDHCRVSTCSQGWDGYALDPFDAGAFKRYWDAVVDPLIDDAGPLAGKTLRYLHTDSWEVEVANWTPTLREEFKKRRGYDMLPWLPVIAGKIVNSRDESNRFLHDFRRTMGDLAIDNHFKLFKDWSHKRGLLIHPESGGPHAVPIDAQQCLGFNDAPMSEFWAWSWRHRVGDENRFFVKQPASAAHTYGRKLVLAEGFTTIGPHWQETLWDNLKPSFDHACTEGLNLLVWHAFVSSPASEGIPGQQYFAGTHLNPLVTWWDKSAPFFDYINRCQALLQQGLPVADVAFYYGDHVPNFARLRKSDPARLGEGYDYDVITEEVILKRMKVKSGRLVLPDGVSYRLLVLPDRTVISLPVLKKLKEFVSDGAIVVGPKPTAATGLRSYPDSDEEVKSIADKLWSNKNVINGKTAREVLLASGVKPDFEALATSANQSPPSFSFIHRRDGDAEIYFVASRATNAVTADCAFRVAGKAPELWNAVTGERKFAAAYEEKEGRTAVPLDFDPCGSWFVIFRESSAKHPPSAKRNVASFTPLSEITGAWAVAFDPKWGGPESAQFDSLVDWTKRPEPGIKFYSGTAVYRKSFEAPSSFGGKSVWLDLGDVRELAEVRVNGQSCGITWSPPFRVDITRALKPGTNQVEIEVVNFWPNRIIGDAPLPNEKRLTKTNIRKLTSENQMMRSGLFGPVRLLERRPPGRTAVGS
ncbi:MAG TPA: glycosyl hydrolase [Verrucomicrobiae bacterium]|nr:glycosyl hydrolase [Verrucomicrobiae bacterium]